jgi:putative DNA primase/helicase
MLDKTVYGTEQAIDLEETELFLDLISANHCAWQTCDDDQNRKDGKLARILHGTLAQHSAELIRLNERGAGVFVAINRTDLRGRRRENIKRVRAVAVDLDGAPLDPVKKCTLPPHVIIETSPGRYHACWRVKGLGLEEFEDIQLAIAKQFDGDPQVALLTHIERLPGFFHRKDPANPFRSRIIDFNEVPAYTAEEIRKQFPPERTAHKPALSNQLILPAGGYLAAAEEFVARSHKAEDVILLRHYRGVFYIWTSTHWKEYADELLERDLYAFLKPAWVLDKKGKPSAYNPTKAKVAEIVHALRRTCQIPPDWEPPCWLGENAYRPAAHLIAVQNGILNLQTRKLKPHSPLFFTTNCAPLDYDRKAPKPRRWHAFLESLWPEDKHGNYDGEAEDALQEIFGYFLTPDTQQQKIFMMIGPPRSGKGTIVHIMEKLIGEDNCTFPTLTGLTGDFGRWPLIDKRVAFITDARIGSRADTHKIAEQLLSISGGDKQTINRKHASYWTGRLNVRFLITTNVLPTIHDASGTIATRYILLKLEQSFLGREDHRLQSRLSEELAGILNWSLDGLDRLRERGYFQQPETSKESIRQLEDAAEPVRAFLREWCTRGLEDTINVKDLYRAYKTWAAEAGHRVLANNVFGVRLGAQLPMLTKKGVGAKRTYVGVALSERGHKELEELVSEMGEARRGRR